MWVLVGDLCANFDPFFPENSFDKEIESFPINTPFPDRYRIYRKEELVVCVFTIFCMYVCM